VRAQEADQVQRPIQLLPLTVSGSCIGVNTLPPVANRLAVECDNAYTKKILQVMSIRPDTRAWIEIDRAALRRNYLAIRRLAGPEVRIIVMVKADGYGLGAERVARALEPLDPWGYGVATAEEGIALRRAGVRRPILVTEPLPVDATAAAASAGLTACISHPGQLERWAAVAPLSPTGLDFHVEIDTGMGRCGLDWRTAAEWVPVLRAYAGANLRWTGVFTHFHSADAPDGSSAEQWARFEAVLREIGAAGPRLMVHAANSAALLRFPAYHASAVRPGLFLYGGDPVPQLRRDGVGGTHLPRPEVVVSVRARIVMVRDVPPGTTVGYGATHRAERPERWATLGIGYGDGLPRALSNVGSVLVRGQRAPIVGRISMDLTVVDVTEIPETTVDDVVTLIGRDGAEEITLEEVAARAGTINHEILSRFGPRLPRVEIGGDADVE